MLQQTRVAVVGGAVPGFLERFPTLDSLAMAPEQEVLALWRGWATKAGAECCTRPRSLWPAS